MPTSRSFSLPFPPLRPFHGFSQSLLFSSPTSPTSPATSAGSGVRQTYAGGAVKKLEQVKDPPKENDGGGTERSGSLPPGLPRDRLDRLGLVPVDREPPPRPHLSRALTARLSPSRGLPSPEGRWTLRSGDARRTVRRAAARRERALRPAGLEHLDPAPVEPDPRQFAAVVPRQLDQSQHPRGEPREEPSRVPGGVYQLLRGRPARLAGIPRRQPREPRVRQHREPREHVVGPRRAGRADTLPEPHKGRSQLRQGRSGLRRGGAPP